MRNYAPESIRGLLLEIASMGQLASVFEVEEIETRVRELRRGSLSSLRRLLQKHNKCTSAVNDKELDLFLHQIKNKMILVAVVGEGSAGKSTLLNAFLRDHFLPSGCGRVTGVRIYIGHKSTIHSDRCSNPSGNCEDCPALYEGFGIDQRPLCRGVDNIRRIIKEENAKPNNNKLLVVYANIPVFDSLDESAHLTPFFVDSPGVEVISDDVKSYYSIQSAMMYIENYGRFLQNNDKIITELALRTVQASLYFVVTQFDLYYMADDEENNPDEERVKNEITTTFGGQIKQHEVFPVSGLWAFKAQMLIRNPNDGHARSVCERASADLRRKRNVTSADNPKSIFERSGLKELEQRLRESVERTDLRRWNVNMLTQCQTLLQGPISAATDLLQEIKIEHKRLEEAIGMKERTKLIMKQREREFYNFCEEDHLKAAITEKLQSVYKESDVNKAIEEAVQSFAAASKEKIGRRQVYKFKNFMKDSKIFQESSFINAMEALMASKAKVTTTTLQTEMKSKYTTFIDCIELNNKEVTFVVNCGSVTLATPDIIVGEFMNTKAFFAKLWDIGKGSATAAGGVGVSSGLYALGYVSATIAAASPLLIIGAPVTLGLAGAAYFGYRAWTGKSDDMIMNVEDIDESCSEMQKKLMDQFRENKEMTLESLKEVVLQEMKRFSGLLKQDYRKNWERKYNQFMSGLDEDKKDLKELKNEINELSNKVTKDLKGFQSSIRDQLNSAVQNMNGD